MRPPTVASLGCGRLGPARRGDVVADGLGWYHLWTPWPNPARIFALLPMVYVAWRVHNMHVAMVVYVAANTIGMVGAARRGRLTTGAGLSAEGRIFSLTTDEAGIS